MFVLVAMSPVAGGKAYAASIKLNKKTVYMLKGKKYQLRVKGTTAKVKWKSLDPTIVKVSKRGKLKAKAYGTATVRAKVRGKKLKCKVIVERKTQKNARTLRDYLLKYGKKKGSSYYIKTTKTTTESDGTVVSYKITANKKNKNLVFYCEKSTQEPPDSWNTSMTINLISGKAALKKGTTKSVFVDGYGDGSWFEYYGEVTTAFREAYDEGYHGITLNKYLSYDENALNKEVTDPATLADEYYVGRATSYLSSGFEYWNKLLASKKPLKKAKITMKSIGFSKF